MHILLIDDDPGIRLSLAAPLRAAGHQVALASDGNEAMRKLRSHRYELVIADIRMPGPDGFTILEYCRRVHRSTDVVLMTAHGEISSAVVAIKQQAADYLVKPFAARELVERVRRIEAQRAIAQEAAQARQPAVTAAHRSGLIGVSSSIRAIGSQIDAIAPSDAPVLITGESGTGKEIVARALHDQSGRARGPFVAFNCTSFPDTLIEAELFGHERGAFTGAVRAREGRFAAAASGTLFLDEISEMNLPCQAKLLRVLQERRYSPLGTNNTNALDARILSATNRSLSELVEARLFREDLYYRIKVLSIDIPPLREREADLLPLAKHFLTKFAKPGQQLGISMAAWFALVNYPFPGNVRELEHAIQHGAVLATAESLSELRLEHLPKEITERQYDDGQSMPLQALEVAMMAAERKYLLQALALHEGNRTRAAQTLGISRKNLWEKIRKHGISNDEIQEEVQLLPPTAIGSPLQGS